MNSDSTAAIYILIFFVIIAGVVAWLVFQVVNSEYKKKETLKIAEQMREANERLAEEDAVRAAAEREAAMAQRALEALNSPDREVRAKENAERQEHENKMRAMQMKVAAERAEMTRQLAFESMEQPIEAFLSVAKPRTLSLATRNIHVAPGSFPIRFSLRGDLNHDPRSVIGLSCRLGQMSWEFADETGQVWELISDLGGEFFSQFPMDKTFSELREKSKLPDSVQVLRTPGVAWFVPSYQFFSDAPKADRESFVTHGILRGLCSGAPARLLETGFAVWKMTVRLSPDASWVCHDTAWNAERNEMLVRDYGWIGPTGKLLPVFYFRLPIVDLCPLTWGFSDPAYKGGYYQDLVLTRTGEKDDPNPGIRVI